MIYKIQVFCLPMAMEQSQVLLLRVWCFYMFCTFVFANHELIFVLLIQGITTVRTFTNFEFVGVAWAQVRTITSRASLIHGFVVFLFSL